MTSPEKLDYRMMPERAEQGLHDLATDVRDALRKHNSKEIKTTESDAKIVNNIYNYPSGTVSRPGVRFGFARDIYVVMWMVFTIVGVYIILSHPQWIVQFGNWIRTVF
jgi:hypothetical protein